jgi:hypothetical protein
MDVVEKSQQYKDVEIMSVTINGSQIAIGRNALGGPDVRLTKDYAPHTARGMKPSNLKSDAFQLSYEAKAFRFHFNDKGVADKPAVSWNEQLKNSKVDPKLKLLDQHIAKAGDILEQMRELAKSAQDEKLSDDTRLGLQIEIGRLQYELDCETDKMFSKYFSGEARVVLHEQKYEDTDAYKMLERAVERMAKGGK